VLSWDVLSDVMTRDRFSALKGHEKGRGGEINRDKGKGARKSEVF